MRRFAISDIHGCSKTFDALLDKLALTTDDELYLLGDYVDRGPDSKGVIDLIWHLQQEGFSVTCLKGNHEEMMLNSRLSAQYFPHWYHQGGRETMESFGCEQLAQIDERYWDFLNQLAYYHEVDQYLLVHAGFNFRVPNPFEDLESMLWIRNWYPQINEEWLAHRIIIHGHTPTPISGIRELYQALRDEKVLVIDNGCVYSHPGMGALCAFEMYEQQLYFQKRID